MQTSPESLALHGDKFRMLPQVVSSLSNNDIRSVLRMASDIEDPSTHFFPQYGMFCEELFVGYCLQLKRTQQSAAELRRGGGGGAKKQSARRRRRRRKLEEDSDSDSDDESS